MEWLLALIAVIAVYVHFRKKADRACEAALRGVWRFDRLIRAKESEWNDHVVMFEDSGAGRIIPSQALRNFTWSVRNGMIDLRVPGVARGRWSYKLVGDELTTEDLDTHNVVVFRRTTDPAVIEELQSEQDVLDKSGIYWDREEYAASFLATNLVKVLSEDQLQKVREAMAAACSTVSEIPPFVQNEFAETIAGAWQAQIGENVLVVDLGFDGIAVFYMGGQPFQTLEYRVTQQTDGTWSLTLYEAEYALSYRVRVLSVGHLHVKTPLMDVIFEPYTAQLSEE